MKRIWSLFAVLALLCALTVPALAAAGGAADAVPTAQTGERGRTRALGEEHHQGAQDLGGGGAYRCGMLWRRAGHGAFRCKGGEHMAEQPEAAGQIRTSMMMGLVFIETVIIYALIVAILIIFVL